MKTGIVDVGGGMRGIFAAGVFDYCMDQGICFDLVINRYLLASRRAAQTPPPSSPDSGEEIMNFIRNIPLKRSI